MAEPQISRLCDCKLIGGGGTDGQAGRMTVNDEIPSQQTYY